VLTSLRHGLLLLTTCVGAAAPFEFKVAGETVVVPESFEARPLPANDPWRLDFEVSRRTAYADFQAPDVYLAFAGSRSEVLMITARPFGVEGLKTYHDTRSFRQLFPRDVEGLRVISPLDERYVVYSGQRDEDDVLFAVALCRGKIFRLNLIHFDESGKPAAYDFIDARILVQNTQLFVQANPVTGENQLNVELLEVLAAFFVLLSGCLFYLKQRRRAQAGGAGSMV
jgi:hypothetical protein